MSTEFATEFGNQHGDTYGEVVSKWSKKLNGINKIGDGLYHEWGTDLQNALGEDVTKELLTQTLGQWKKADLTLPSEEVIKMFAAISVKGALATDTKDLLQRLRTSVSETETITAAFLRPETLILKASQTVAQIFDMAADRFNSIMDRFLQRKKTMTGRKRWRTSSLKTSRHKSVDGQIRSEGETFTVNGESVLGPRPPGGSPANWSNCSCILELEKSDGEWIRVS